MPVKYSPAATAAAGAAAAAVPPNILLASLDYGDANWLKSRLSVQTNVAAAPGGAQTADKLIEDTTSGNHEIRQLFTKPAGVTRLFASVTVYMTVNARDAKSFRKSENQLAGELAVRLARAKHRNT